MSPLPDAHVDIPHWELQNNTGSVTVVLSGTWLARTADIPRFPDDSFLQRRGDSGTLEFNTQAVQSWDTGLIAFIWEVTRAAKDAGLHTSLEQLPAPMRKLMELLPDTIASPAPVAPRPKLLETIGSGSINGLAEIGTVTELTVEVIKNGCLTLVGRGRMRGVDLLNDTVDAGPSALLIVGVVNLLVGAILAFVGASQLQKFAAGIYVAALVGIATVREMAAVMTAIIMAGRTGGAYAARISTMQGNEEIDALRVFGIPVSTYLILPSVLSLTITMPFLYLYGCVIGMFGGFLVATAMLDLTPAGYFHATISAFGVGQFLFGFVKSIVFGAFIGLTSCRIGLKAGRSASDVGIAATRAVVVGIVGVILIDAIFAVVANAVGI
ncbi:MlaE family ABC transporter permease [Brytella acorum]|uniref:MlaE family ABC transporter permease n=1 Tax=Brytella acorum TaxID=2959299 RepID=UPI0037423099